MNVVYCIIWYCALYIASYNILAILVVWCEYENLVDEVTHLWYRPRLLLYSVTWPVDMSVLVIIGGGIDWTLFQSSCFCEIWLIRSVALQKILRPVKKVKIIWVPKWNFLKMLPKQSDLVLLLKVIWLKIVWHVWWKSNNSKKIVSRQCCLTWLVAHHMTWVLHWGVWRSDFWNFWKRQKDKKDRKTERQKRQKDTKTKRQKDKKTKKDKKIKWSKDKNKKTKISHKTFNHEIFNQTN